MNLDSLNKWLALAANIGVIAGIFFLALEFQQYQEEMSSQSRFNYFSTRVEMQKTLSIDPIITPIIFKSRVGETLTPLESFRLFQLVRTILIAWKYEFGEYAEGRIELIELDVAGKRGLYRNPTLPFGEVYSGIKDQFEPESNFVSFMETYIVSQ